VSKPLAMVAAASRRKTVTKGKRILKSNKRHVAGRRASKPQSIKKELVKLAKQVATANRRPCKPHIISERPGCIGLVLGQAPPGPRKSLPRGWRPLAGPAEQRLARLAGLASPAELWTKFDRGNLLSWYPGLKERSAKQDVAKGYTKHQSDGDVFPQESARRAAAAVQLERYKCVVLLGNNVARAFGVRAGLMQAEVRDGSRLLTFPHPSGVSHFWNDPANVRRAAGVFRAELRRMRRQQPKKTVVIGTKRKRNHVCKS